MRYRCVLIVLLALLPIPLQAEKPEVRAGFLKLLDRPRVPLDVQSVSTTTSKDGFVHEHLTFASEKKADGSIERVPVIVVRPAKIEKKLPAVIVLHGTGGSAK